MFNTFGLSDFVECDALILLCNDFDEFDGLIENDFDGLIFDKLGTFFFRIGGAIGGGIEVTPCGGGGGGISSCCSSSCCCSW